jgi:hypothetical protein
MNKYFSRKQFFKFLSSFHNEEDLAFVVYYLMGEYNFNKLVANYYVYRGLMNDLHPEDIYNNCPPDFRLDKTQIQRKKKQLASDKNPDMFLFRQLMQRERQSRILSTAVILSVPILEDEEPVLSAKQLARVQSDTDWAVYWAVYYLRSTSRKESPSNALKIEKKGKV